MNRASCVSVIGGALAAASLASRAAAQPAITTIRVGATPIDSISPVLYANRVGMFERAGLKLELTMMGSGNAVSGAVAGGALDVGVSSLVALIEAHLRGIPLMVLAPSGLWVGTDVSGLVVASASPLRTARDFNGKTISTNALQSLDTMAMQAWMDTNGGDSKTVHFFELPALAATAALEQGRVDGSILSNPAYAAAHTAGARTAGHIYDAVGKQFLLGVWFATESYIAANRSAAQRFSRVVAEAATYALAHPDDTVQDVAQITKLDPDLIRHMQRTHVGTIVRASDIQPVIDTAVKYNVIEKGFQAAEMISDAAAR